MKNKAIIYCTDPHHICLLSLHAFQQAKQQRIR